MVTFGGRLKRIRLAAGLSQTDFADLVGVTKKTQGLYERDERMPDAGYLMKLIEHGYDTNYLLTGKTLAVHQVAEPAVCYVGDQGGDITREEQILLENYRSLSEEDRRAIRRQSDVLAELKKLKSQAG